MPLSPDGTAYLYENVGFNTPLASDGLAYLYENVGFSLELPKNWVVGAVGIGPHAPYAETTAYLYEDIESMWP
jgi:hypothetical protein